MIKLKTANTCVVLNSLCFLKTLTGKILFKIWPVGVDLIRALQLSHLTCLALHP